MITCVIQSGVSREEGEVGCRSNPNDRELKSTIVTSEDFASGLEDFDTDHVIAEYTFEAYIRHIVRPSRSQVASLTPRIESTRAPLC